MCQVHTWLKDVLSLVKQIETSCSEGLWSVPVLLLPAKLSTFIQKVAARLTAPRPAHPPTPAPGGLLPDPRAPLDPVALGSARAPWRATRDLHGGGPEPREQHLVRRAGGTEGKEGGRVTGSTDGETEARGGGRLPGGSGQGSDLSLLPAGP